MEGWREGGRKGWREREKEGGRVKGGRKGGGKEGGGRTEAVGVEGGERRVGGPRKGGLDRRRYPLLCKRFSFTPLNINAIVLPSSAN